MKHLLEAIPLQTQVSFSNYLQRHGRLVCGLGRTAESDRAVELVPYTTGPSHHGTTSQFSRTWLLGRTRCGLVGREGFVLDEKDPFGFLLLLRRLLLTDLPRLAPAAAGPPLLLLLRRRRGPAQILEELHVLARRRRRRRRRGVGRFALGRHQREETGGDRWTPHVVLEASGKRPDGCLTHGSDARTTTAATPFIEWRADGENGPAALAFFSLVLPCYSVETVCLSRTSVS